MHDYNVLRCLSIPPSPIIRVQSTCGCCQEMPVARAVMVERKRWCDVSTCSFRVGLRLPKAYRRFVRLVATPPRPDVCMLKRGDRGEEGGIGARVGRGCRSRYEVCSVWGVFVLTSSLVRRQRETGYGSTSTSAISNGQLTMTCSLYPATKVER